MSTTTLGTRRAGLANIGRSAVAVGATSVANGVLGVAFWVVAARTYGPAEVGRDALLILVVQTVAAATDLNLNVALPRLLPQLGQRRGRTVAGSYATITALGAGAGLLIVLVPVGFADGMTVPDGDMRLAVAVVAAVSVWGMFALQDNILITVRRSGWVPASNIAFGAAKLALVVVFAAGDVSGGIFLAWLLPLPVLILVVALGPIRSGIRDYDSDATLRVGGAAPTRSALASFLAFDYAALLLQQIGAALMPVVITLRLGAAPNAWFTMAFTAAVAAEAVLVATTNALTSEAAAASDRAVCLVRTTIRRTGLLLGVGVPVAIVAAGPVMSVFGESYARHATGPLQAMIVAAVPLAVLVLRAGLWRIEGRAWPIFATHCTAFGLLAASVVPTADRWGIAGVAWTWCAAMAVPALVVLPAVVRAATAPQEVKGIA